MIDQDVPAPRVRTEWSVHLKGELGVFGTEHTFPVLEGEHHARASAERWRATRPDVDVTLVQRRTVTTYGPWEAVPF